MSLSIDKYTEAVILLMETALGRTSGARAAAQVLLSAYNGFSWQLDITDLSCLDSDRYQAALVVIRGRIELRMEPQYLIDDGSKHFTNLWNLWPHLSVKERGKTSCYWCNGTGQVSADRYDDNDMTMTTCYDCDGKGRYWEE